MPRFSSKEFEFERAPATPSDIPSQYQKDVTREPKIKEILIPGGKAAKVVQIPDPTYEGLRVSDIADRLKFN